MPNIHVYCIINIIIIIINIINYAATFDLLLRGCIL